jgi:hypothetical protein
MARIFAGGWFPNKGKINPQSVAAAGTANSPWINVFDAYKLLMNINCGALGGGSVQASFLQATDNAGTGSKALTAGTFVAPAAITVDGTLQQIEANPEDLDRLASPMFTFVRLVLTNTGGTGALLAADMFNVDPLYKTA